MGLWAWIKGEEPGFFETIFHYKNPGQFGEYATEYALGHDNLKGYSKTVHNVYLPHREGTTELDVLMVHEKGVFVFESKNYSGWIFGSAEQQQWTQQLPNREKNRFYNPLKQNVTHCRALADFLDIPSEQIHSYVVFSQRCELKKVPEDTGEYVICKRPDMLKKLRKQLAGMAVCFSREQVDSMTERLLHAADVTEEQKQKHIDDIKEKTEGSVCPFCGGELTARKGKYGAFYGCGNYPKCRYTRKIENQPAEETT